MKILGIETSCDETGIALLEAEDINPPYFNLLKNEIHSQVDLHREYGGVVPSLARREHAKNLIPVLCKVLELDCSQTTNSKRIPKSKLQKIEKYFERYPELLKEFKEKIVQLEKPGDDPVSSSAGVKSTNPKDHGATTTNGVDLIAVTKGPGLEPALWVGINFARSLSVLWDVPIIGVDHMEGHLAANLLLQDGLNSKVKSQKSKVAGKSIDFPAVALAVSGGHTQLILIKKWGEYELLGETQDDAAGEAFDKIARLLGLPYPGGPVIEEKAAQWESQNPNCKLQINSKIQLSNKNIEISLPIPMLKSGDLNFSFSGLKTAVLYDYKSREEKIKKSENYIGAMAFAVQQAITTVLVEKTKKAVEKHSSGTVMLAGGVAANKFLRKELEKHIEEANISMPPVNLALDNGAMIAAAGYLNYQQGVRSNPETIKAEGTRVITEE